LSEYSLAARFPMGNFREGFGPASDARVGADADISLFIDIISNFLIRCTVGMAIASR
jgi:hypothetical protein